MEWKNKSGVKEERSRFMGFLFSIYVD